MMRSSQAVDIVSFLRAGEFIYLHCGDGNGRSGVIAAAVLGISHDLNPVEALALLAQSREHRIGQAGASPETHEQRMIIHRVLSDKTLASKVSPRASDGSAALSGALLASTIAKICGLVARRGLTGLLTLKRDAAVAANVPPPIGARVTGYFNRPAFDAFCNRAGWFLTASEAEALWSAALSESTSSRSLAVEGPAPHGSVLATALFSVVSGKMTARRSALVEAAFSRIAEAEVAPTSVPLERIALKFSANGHPEVRANRRAPADVTQDFLDSFGMGLRSRARGGGGVLREDFSSYYTDISAVVPDDAYFELLLNGCWPAAAASVVSLRTPVAVSRDPGSAPNLPASAPSIFAHLTPAETRSVESLCSALRARLLNAGDLGIVHLSVSLRRADTDADGYLTSQEFQSALRDTILTCTGAAPAQGITAVPSISTSGADVSPSRRRAIAQRAHNQEAEPLVCSAAAASVVHPLIISEADSDIVFTAVLRHVGGSSSGVETAKLSFSDLYSTICGPASRSQARAAVSSALWASLDARKEGSVPVAELLRLFRADALPGVESSRIPSTRAFRVFVDAFGESFALYDSRGPARRLRGGAAAGAYAGTGNGRVAAPFWSEWMEGLAAAAADDAAFALVSHRVWAGGRLAAHSNVGNARYDAAHDSRCAEIETGLHGRIQELGRAGGPGARAPAPRGQFSLESESSSASMRGLLPGPPSAQNVGAVRGRGLETLAVPVSTSAIPLGPATPGGYESAAHALGAVAHVASPMGRAPAIAASRRGTTPAQDGFFNESGVVKSGYVPPGGQSSSAAGRDSSPLAEAIRTALRGTGVRASLALVRALEMASASCEADANGAHSPTGSRNHLSYPPLPANAAIACLRDAGARLGPRSVDDICALYPHSQGGQRDIDALRLFDAVFGALTPARSSVVASAYAHVSSLVARGVGASPAGAAPSLADFHFLYASASHPDVRAGKRSEEAVLREFLEFFSGPTFTAGPDGFTRFYAAMSLHEDSDAAFAATIFDTWGLGFAKGRSTAAGGNSMPTRPDVSVSTLMGREAPTYRTGPRGPGPEGLPAAAYTSGQALAGTSDDFTSASAARRSRLGWGVERY